MKNILLGIVFIVGMFIVSYYVGYGIAVIGKSIEGVYGTYPEKKYGW